MVDEGCQTQRGHQHLALAATLVTGAFLPHWQLLVPRLKDGNGRSDSGIVGPQGAP